MKIQWIIFGFIVVLLATTSNAYRNVSVKLSREQERCIKIEQNSYTTGYIKGAYECLKSDSLILCFIKTHDLTPEQQGQMIEIYDMSRAVNQELGWILPDLTLAEL
jgi:hypothetical protein